MIKLLALALAVALTACSTLASPPGWNTDLTKTLAQARQQDKMAFILLGREDCHNCEVTRNMVDQQKVPVSPEKFIVAEINTDDPQADAEFLKRFGRDNFGDTLPFVVITDSNGKALARFSGAKSATEITALVSQASARAAR